MEQIKNFYNKNIKHILINKFAYKNIKNLPVLEKVVLNFNCKSVEIKKIASSSLILESISSQKSKINKARKSNIMIKLRKGQPTGCKIELSKKNRLIFLLRLVFEIIPKLKNFSEFSIKTKNMFSFKIKDIFCFNELENHYNIFNFSENLQITVVLKTKNILETRWLLTLIKFSVLNRKQI